MIWSAFRPSDDRVRFPFNIPQQMFAVVGLRELAELAIAGYGDSKLAGDASRLADEVHLGIERHGLVYTHQFGIIYAYEVDGLGHALLADDANMPNLTTAGYYGFAAPTSQAYTDTRRFALSNANTYYYRGKYAAGLGSAHSPTGWVWPLGLIGAALTTREPRDVALAISTIEDTNRFNGLIHESFDPSDPDRFTRAEFGWANATYAELIFRSAAGFDADPLPSAVAGIDFPAQRTPVIVDIPQLWFNAVLIESELSDLLQEQ
jgi:meiotically up-regulated gene 157 (Mug157) protein